MRKLWRFVRRFWWALLVGLATVVSAIAAALFAPPKRDIGQGLGYVPKKPFKQQAAEQAERVRLEGEVEKARVKARAQIEDDELDEIERIGDNDPAEGRKRLARWLSEHL